MKKDDSDVFMTSKKNGGKKSNNK